MLDKKIAAYSKTHQMLPTKPNAQAGLTAADLKAWYDTAPEEIRVKFNALIDELASTVGAAQIGVTAIPGISGENIQSVLVALKAYTESHVSTELAPVSQAAQNAVDTANAANSNASSAVSTANTANSNANTAVSTANTALSTANTALETAGDAVGTANSTQSAFEAIEPTLLQAVEDAEAAVLAVAGKADVAYVDQVAANFVLGTLSEGSVVEEMLASPLMAKINAPSKFSTSTGTGTALVVTIGAFDLEDGRSFTFIPHASNSGAATTINADSKGAIPLYKPSTTTAPNTTAGKPITVWYNLAGNCFFLKASAEGNAIAANVLAGKTFSNDSDTGIAGTIPVRTGDVMSSAILPTIYGDIILTPPTGFYDGSTRVYANDPDFVASNFLANKNVFGLQGSIPVRDGNTASTANDGTSTVGRLYLRPQLGYYDGSNDFTYVEDADFIQSNIKKNVNIFGLTGTLEWEYTLKENMLLMAQGIASPSTINEVISDNVGNFFYTIGGGGIRKLNPSNAVDVATNVNANANAPCMDQDDDYIYAPYSSLAISKYSKSTLAIVATSDNITSTQNILGIAVDSNYVYVLVNMNSSAGARIRKLNKSNLSYVGDYTVATRPLGYNMLEHDANYLYYCDNTNKIIRINKSNMTFSAEVNIYAGAYDLLRIGSTLYCAVGSAVRIIDLNNFTAGSSQVTTEAYAIVSDGNHIYTTNAYSTINAIVSKRDLNLNVISSITTTVINTTASYKKIAINGHRFCIGNYTVPEMYATAIYIK